MRADQSTKALAAVFVFVAVWVVGYLTTAFMCWSWNPGEWDVSARAMTGVFCTMAGAFLSLAVMA